MRDTTLDSPQDELHELMRTQYTASLPFDATPDVYDRGLALLPVEHRWQAPLDDACQTDGFRERCNLMGRAFEQEALIRTVGVWLMHEAEGSTERVEKCRAPLAQSPPDCRWMATPPRVDINTASEEALIEVFKWHTDDPGDAKALVKTTLERRTTQGPYASVEEFIRENTLPSRFAYAPLTTAQAQANKPLLSYLWKLQGQPGAIDLIIHLDPPLMLPASDNAESIMRSLGWRPGVPSGPWLQPDAGLPIDEAERAAALAKLEARKREVLETKREQRKRRKTEQEGTGPLRDSEVQDPVYANAKINKVTRCLDEAYTRLNRPIHVTVKVTVWPWTGSATIETNSEDEALDRCLVATYESLQFRTFEGKPKSYSFPFNYE